VHTLNAVQVVGLKVLQDTCMHTEWMSESHVGSCHLSSGESCVQRPVWACVEHDWFWRAFGGGWLMVMYAKQDAHEQNDETHHEEYMVHDMLPHKHSVHL